MAFPSTSGSVPITLEAGWEQARSLAANIKAQASAMASAAQGNGLGADQILAAYTFYLNSVAAFNTIAAIPGIASYAQAQIGSSTENISADFTTMVSAIQNAAAWIKANFPHDSATPANLLYVQFSSTGAIQYTQFTPAQLTGFVSVLNSVIATID